MELDKAHVTKRKKSVKQEHFLKYFDSEIWQSTNRFISHVLKWTTLKLEVILKRCKKFNSLFQHASIFDDLKVQSRPLCNYFPNMLMMKVSFHKRDSLIMYKTIL